MITLNKGEKPRVDEHGNRPHLAHWIRWLSVPIILGWLALTVITNIIVPQVEVVGQEQSVPMSAADAPSTIAMNTIGKTFQEFDSNTSVMIVLEGDQPLGDAAHKYYNEIVTKLEADKKHVEHIQDFWSDPLTAAGSQSADGKSAYVQAYLAGNMGEGLANESVEAAKKIVESVPAPPGVKAYVTGPSALIADTHIAGDRSLKMITGLTFGVITVMLLFVYRSIVTVVLALFMVFLELAAARGVVAFLGHHHLIGLSTFAVNLLVMVAIAAGTDYVIFLFGRYQEARGKGASKESAYYEMYHGTGHVIMGSGLTIAGALFCLHFTRSPMFNSMGVPLFVGMLVMVAAALTLGPAVVTVASHFNLLEPKRASRERFWRRIGTAVVRWPGPILVATTFVCLIGLLALPGYRTDYNDRHYLPPDIPAAEGFAAAERHFPESRLSPELLMLQSDHDLRNSADFLVIDRVAKAMFHTPGIGRVQTITRPLGTPIEHSSIPFLLGMQGTTQTLNQSYLQDRMKDMLKMGDDMQVSINTMTQMYDLMGDLNAVTHSMVGKMDITLADIQTLRNHIADFDDFLRPIRNYLYWEPHCYDVPMCWSIRSVFDTLDGIDTMTDDFQTLVPELHKLDVLTASMRTLMPPMIATMKSMQGMQLTMESTQSGMYDQMQAMQDNQSAMGKAFDAAKNDDSFYLPPEAFDNPDFKRGMKMFLSPDGKAVRFIISHEGDPMSPEGLSHVDPIKNAAFEAIKGTPLEGSKIYLAGTAASYKDMQDSANYDLLIAGIAALCLIFIIMLIITRAVVAAAVIVGTVLLSLGTSFGLSVLIWQDLIGRPLHWMVLVMSVIILLAVGSDYNLLLVARLKEEVGAGISTGIIRAMGGSGSVVTSAGLVFAVTMAAMAFSELTILAQVGTTIGMGLLVDTLVIRSFMTPSIAALLGRWFWWPQRVRKRPAPSPWPSAKAENTQPIAVESGSTAPPG
ncbi:MMPL family transporter [Mycolicibacterium sp. CH28]|uniref:MMPL/RND family transporter n=1 Tax=Mycolicibacterium sp. CH28 TaxID=2512237 RepID=UPI001080EE41|nr:MMPL family transporter [Mycolicibacterium sp. CH28]TGD90318.1 MMPL family transporter [Mycolicibacterium sp. CH28]